MNLVYNCYGINFLYSDLMDCVCSNLCILFETAVLSSFFGVFIDLIEVFLKRNFAKYVVVAVISLTLNFITLLINNDLRNFIVL